MMIDPKTGAMRFDDLAVCVEASLTRSRFLETLGGAASVVLIRNEPWCTYRLPDIPLQNGRLIVSVGFHEERLASVSLFLSAEQFGSSWDDWSEQRERERQSFQERWLAEEVGVPCGRYRWGQVSSGYDPRGGTSSITIVYSP